MAGNEPRGTKMSDKQKEIKNRPRKNEGEYVAHVISDRAEVVTTPRTFLDESVPFEAKLADITVIISELIPQEVDLSILVRDGNMTESYTFKVKKGLNEIEKDIKVFRGSIIQVRLDHPIDFEAKDVYFSASIKRH